MAILFSADPHFCHRNIAEYCDRPFSTVDEMNSALISNWNKVVDEQDTVYLLGDIGMGKRWELVQCFFSLNGHIHWIVGNHDKRAVRWEELRKRFTWIGDYKEIRVPDEDPAVSYRGNPYCKIVLFHYPIVSWNGMHKGSWHIHGHCHGTYYNSDNKIVDVGVDCWDYTPVSYERLKEYMIKRSFLAVDGHGKQGTYKK